MNSLQILVVDDDYDFAESLAEVLEDRGHAITIANSGEEAIEVFNNDKFDLIFMDVKLPGMNGVESFLAIRAAHPTARCYMMTAYSIEQLLQQAVKNGALGILAKPLILPELFLLLEKILPNGLILVVDDDNDFSETLKESLAMAGYNALLAANAKQAFDMNNRHDFDVLLLDLRLPILNGMEIYLELIKQGQLIPTIIVSAYLGDEPDQIVKLTEKNVLHHISKPFEMEKLLTMISEII